MINTQARASSVPRGWGNDTRQTIAPGEQTAIRHPLIVPAFPGTVRVRLSITDVTDPMWLARREDSAEFSLANTNIRALRLPPSLQQLLRVEKSEYPRLRMAERGQFVFYYLEGDSYAESRLEEVARRREQTYAELAAKLNPGFRERVVIYLFPDADSKLAYTGHRGAGWAQGKVLVEIFNEKEQLDPYHELVHIIAGSVGDPPALFSEGLAAYLQEGHRWDGYHVDAWAKPFAAGRLLWPVYELFGFTDIGPEQTKPPIAYPQAASLVKYLAERYGFEKVMQGFKGLKRSSSEEDRSANAGKFAAIFGASIQAVEKAWLDSLNHATVEPVPELRIAEIKSKLKKTE